MKNVLLFVILFFATSSQIAHAADLGIVARATRWLGYQQVPNPAKPADWVTVDQNGECSDDVTPAQARALKAKANEAVLVSVDKKGQVHFE